MPNILRGRRIPVRGRRPTLDQENRICKKRGCKTLLSKYNPRDYCYLHTPVKFPRVRGIVTKDK